MTDKKDGGAAFPHVNQDMPGHPGTVRIITDGGMSLRDWYAGQAPPMLYHFKIDSVTKDSSEQLVEAISAWNYLYADAMIKEREKWV